MAKKEKAPKAKKEGAKRGRPTVSGSKRQKMLARWAKDGKPGPGRPKGTKSVNKKKVKPAKETVAPAAETKVEVAEPVTA